MSLELGIRICGTALEALGVLVITCRIAYHRDVPGRIRRRFMRMVGRPQAVTKNVRTGDLMTFGGKASPTRSRLTAQMIGHIFWRCGER